MTNEVPMKFQMLVKQRLIKKKKKITKERNNDTRRQQQNAVVCQGDQPAWGEERQPLRPSVSSSAVGGAGQDISGSFVSPHLLFSRLWVNKYELIH